MRGDTERAAARAQLYRYDQKPLLHTWHHNGNTYCWQRLETALQLTPEDAPPNELHELRVNTNAAWVEKNIHLCCGFADRLQAVV